MQKFVNLNLYYLGKSKKHVIFRAKKWNKDLEKIVNKPILNEKYEEIGYVKEIFGPINLPFISLKLLPNKEYDPKDKLYSKLR